LIASIFVARCRFFSFDPSRQLFFLVSAFATMVAADFSRRIATSPFQAQGEISPGKNALLHHTTAAFTPPRFDHKSFATFCSLTLLDSALYAVLVHRLVIYA
jgi:hypothetical protein